MKYKQVNCGRCLNSRIVYSDIHPTAWICPVCNQMHGVTWDKGYTQLPESEYAVPGYYVGEGDYDWDWLEYDAPNQVTS